MTAKTAQELEAEVAALRGAIGDALRVLDGALRSDIRDQLSVILSAARGPSKLAPPPPARSPEERIDAALALLRDRRAIVMLGPLAFGRVERVLRGEE